MTYINNSNFHPIHKATELLVYNAVTRKFLRKKVDEEKCIACGKCQMICPYDNIQLINKKAHVNSNCTECFGCVHVCPRQAIYVRKRLSKNNQYINKNIDVNELNQ
ncbi:4Fe-4S dicluster domain-containing protein [Acidaminobacter sp. JC074]|uniref:4Fe-4S binding protein n=1 Tax=Acidaminobacter sp. JC074 TaxID=2530199 RepID=UPI0021737D5E|nr:4Fe-4S dicluster domain-containing protein [Acidaminobacter sp. JC074]